MTWHQFDELVDGVADRLTREEDARRAVYRYDPAYRCPKCDTTFRTQAERDDHMRATYNPDLLPRWMT